MRGANKIDPYATTVLNKKTTRLFVDAKTAEEWHSKFGFWPILSKDTDKDKQIENSPFLRFLNLKKDHPVAKRAFDGRSRICPKPNYLEKTPKPQGISIPNFDDMKIYENTVSWGGMPYGLPQISEKEREVLDTWVSMGAPGPTLSEEAASKDAEVVKWEMYFNTTGHKNELVARYLYEHLFLARIHFPQSHDQKKFYRLVRSSTPRGEVVDEIPTRRPFDDPKKKFFYRFVEVRSTIVAKNHVIYELDQSKMKRYKELFFDQQWNFISRSDDYDSYERDVKANPYDVFAEIPAKSRYQFLLDDAEYFIRTFIRGPVCNGGAATNVIDDHFWVSFLDPDNDPAVTNRNFLYDNRSYLEMPSATKPFWNSVEYVFNRPEYSDNVNLFNQKYSKLFKKTFLKKPGVEDLWDGDGNNDNALLTVFRHFDSSTVQKGFLGRTPKTVWVINYQILETIYYNLVANFDVYGNAIFKASTRIFMEASRMSSEHMFLNLIPEEERFQMRNYWNRDKEGFSDGKKKMDSYLFYSLENNINLAEIRIASLADNTKQVEKVIDKYLSRLNPSIYQTSLVSMRCFFCENMANNENQIDLMIRKLLKNQNIHGEILNLFPELSYIRITDNGQPVAWYSIVKNTGHYNVAALFGEKNRILEKESYLDFYKGFIGSYPNVYFSVDKNDLQKFLTELSTIKKNNVHMYMDASEDSEISSALLGDYVIGRYHPDFWTINQQAVEAFRFKEYGAGPIRAGIFDLSRYANVYN